MSKVHVSLACGRYSRTEALLDGRVRPQGLEVTPLELPPFEMFGRQLRHGEFDISELSLSAHIMSVSRGDPRFVGLPVFPSRVFRHSSIFVRADAGIETPEQLAGRRVGVPEYHMTAALFARGLLSDEFGVDARDVRWTQAGIVRAGRRERVELELPEGVELEVDERATLTELLLDGKIDAVIAPSVPAAFLRHKDRIRRLFRDPRAVEADYFRRTGIFPIMHLVVVKAELLERHPWVAQEVVKAFTAARDRAREEAGRAAIGSWLPWHQLEYEQTAELLGEDPWPYGVAANRPTLEAALRYSQEQGLSARRVEVEELFSPATLEEHVR